MNGYRLNQFKILPDQVERYRRHGLACADLGTDGHWSKLLVADGYSIDVSSLLEHGQPAHAWVKEMWRAPQVFLGSAKAHAAKNATTIDSSKRLKSLDVIIRQAHPNRNYDVPVELIPVYQE